MSDFEDQLRSAQSKLNRFLEMRGEPRFEHVAESSLEFIQESTDLLLGYHRQIKHIATLRDITASLLSLHSEFKLKQVLDKVTESARSLIDADSAVIIPTTNTGRKFLLDKVSIAGTPTEEFRSSGAPRVGGITEYLLSASQGQVNVKNTEDKQQYPFLDDHPESFIRRTGVKAFIATRLGSPADIAGLLFVNRNNPRPFNEEEQELVGIFANFATIAVQNARLFEVTELAANRRLRSGEAINQLQSAIASMTGNELAIGLRGLLEQILHIALDFASLKEMGWGSVQLVDEQTNSLIIHASVGLKENDKALRLKIGEQSQDSQGITGWVAKQGKSALISDVADDPRYIKLVSDSQSELAVPVKDGERTIGVINIESPMTSSFNEDDQRLLETLSAFAVMVVKNIRLYGTLKEVSNLIHSMISTRDPDEVLSLFYDSVSRLTNARDMAILSFDEDDNILSLGRFPMRASEKTSPFLSVHLGEGVSGRAAFLGSTIYEPDVCKLQDKGKKYITWIEDTRANLATPLKVGERLIGVLNIESPVPHSFDEVPQELLTILSSTAAIAINNAQKSKQLVDSQAYAILSSVIGGQFHDIIGNDVSAIDGILQEIPEKCPDELRNSELSNRLAIIASCVATAKEKSQILFYQFRQQIDKVSTLEEQLALALEDYRLPPTIRLVKSYPPEIGSLRVLGPLRTILGNLIRNAITAMDSNGTLTIQAESHGNSLRVTVTDTGRGIQPDLLPNKIFEAQEPKTPGHIGYGLWAIKTILNIIDGAIHVESEPGLTTITFRVPLAGKDE